ncbi:hypothetical protein NDU88_008561 [Pleurodeles waltl]|uniref:Uncharacterized protein n=1 Tax=Pleurodeles waltl TaxID=8319 RepID=A0AAV7QT50_PLEWA|nr:hypothetical protein NDU88_008561 [Pleurodeles waltl]
MHFQDRIPGSGKMLSFIGSHLLPSAGLGNQVVAAPGAAKGALRLIRSKQHVACLTWGHPPASGSPHLCRTLLTLHNTGPAQLGITLALGPGRLGSSYGSSSRSGGPNCQPGSAASGSHSWHPGGC